MQITVNGEKRTYEGAPRLSALLQSLGINPRSVAVELNLSIVARDAIESEPLREGDTIEIIRMVGGG